MDELSTAAAKAVPALGIALITLLLGWLLGQRIAFYWDTVKKKREHEVEALTRFYELYGEFHAVWKIWSIYKDPSKYLVGHERDSQTAWKLLERASDVEGGFESLLMRLTQERELGKPDIRKLARFREANQCLRESIRVDKS